MMYFINIILYRYVAVPGNSSLVKQMAADLSAHIKYNTRVAQLKWTDAKEWSLVDDKGQVHITILPFIVKTCFDTCHF